MRIEFIEIGNFRKLRSTQISFSKDKTVFVGANNSGKTSAMVALRYFLVERERINFSLNDFTLSHWPTIDAMGKSWEEAQAADKSLPVPDWSEVVPFLDLWLWVEDREFHYVQKLLPNLDWVGGLLGVRLRFGPKDPIKLQEEYLTARTDAEDRQKAGNTISEPEMAEAQNGKEQTIVSLWPQNLTEFLQRRVGSTFGVKAYVLDPNRCQDPEHGVAQPQALIDGSEPIEGDPLKGLIRINEISAQRGFGGTEYARNIDDDENKSVTTLSGSRRLSEQLRRYYNRHLNPYENPDAQDLRALKAIEEAQKAFDGRLRVGFASALKEMEKLGYPGVANPKINISTRLSPIDGLKHEAAVQYIIPLTNDETSVNLRLPEDSNGLGYQNLISMVFRLMSFRDAWMRVGKAESRVTSLDDDFVAPLHLVLVEEPEAYLHTQVQQLFIRQAYQILRSHDSLKDNKDLTSQLVVSTHSSHIAHECDFSSLRYFRRMPADKGEIPTARVVNLSNVFGEDTATQRFVTRYLKVTHCDLLFADAAVFIEGPAERILAPHFIQHHDEFKGLSECYITWLEIGGSHAHRMKNLVENLGLTTLIITDLDAIDDNRYSVAPMRDAKQRTRNETLKQWCPATENLDELIDKLPTEKVKSYKNERFAIRVAYQSPISINFKGVVGDALANTLEDALVFQNIDLFADRNGKGLLAKFKKTIADSKTIDELSEGLFKDLQAGGKAEFALDLLEIEDAQTLQPPAYIQEGLLWLAGRLRVQQEELGLAVPTIGSDDKNEEATR